MGMFKRKRWGRRGLITYTGGAQVTVEQVEQVQHLTRVSVIDVAGVADDYRKKELRKAVENKWIKTDEIAWLDLEPLQSNESDDESDD